MAALRAINNRILIFKLLGDRLQSSGLLHCEMDRIRKWTIEWTALGTADE